MSIGAASTLTRNGEAIWLIWLGTAIILALTTRLIRWPVSNGTNASASTPVPLLAATAVLTFVAWLVTNAVYASLTRQVDPVDGLVRVPPHHLVLLSALAPLVGWLAATLLMVRWRLGTLMGLGSHSLAAGTVAGIIGILITLPLVMLTSQLMLQLWEALGLQHAERHELLQIYLNADRPWVRPTIWLAAVVLAPLFEEVLFRGLIQNAFTRVTHAPWAG
ncbi:MAG TPA: CPBP family glutamic-type intramembrane protease, partial [Tepidisphaeraceae bacterium]